MTPSKLKQLRSTAAAVGAQTTALDIAGTDAAMAKGELLDAVIDAIRPALRAICSRVVTGNTVRAGICMADWASWRGVWISGKDKTGLYLTANGDFVVLRYKDMQVTCGWAAEEINIDATQAAADYGLPSILESLDDALDSQATGAAPTRAASLRNTAERLRALCKLVQSWR
jgi:hypothetical protein